MRGDEINRDEYIRASIAYLFRIKLDDKYLLIRNVKSSGWGMYKPVGGCYKFFDSAKPALNNLGVIEEVSDNKDFRVYVPKKNWEKFICWYNLGQDREVDFSREFNEELFEENNFLSPENFDEVDFKKIKDGSFEVNFSKSYKIDASFPMDVVDVNLTPEQASDLRDMVENSDGMFALADEQSIINEEIEVDGREIKIAYHAQELLDAPVETQGI